MKFRDSVWTKGAFAKAGEEGGGEGGPLREIEDPWPFERMRVSYSLRKVKSVSNR